MTTRKKLGSKLAHSVRQVKSQWDQSDSEPSTARAAEKPAKSATNRVAKTTDRKGFRPNRVWPD